MYSIQNNLERNFLSWYYYYPTASLQWFTVEQLQVEEQVHYQIGKKHQGHNKWERNSSIALYLSQIKGFLIACCDNNASSTKTTANQLVNLKDKQSVRFRIASSL